MARLFNRGSKEEMNFLNSWFHQRVIRNNQNVILTFTGATGSGKTYNCLSTGESWYKHQFNQEFPIDNVCFSLGDLMSRINKLKKEGKIRKGELFILEEAGANFGSLDFQNKLSKMFGYILQSFRSLNLILLMTLPVLTMLNKSARQLVHGNFITAGIDHENKEGIVKPLFHQLNQQTGKSYWKYPRFKIRSKMRTLNRMKFPIADEKLIKSYEKKKEEFVYGLTMGFEEINEEQNNKNIIKKQLTAMQMKVCELLKEHNVQEVAKLLDISDTMVYEHKKSIIKKGIDLIPVYDNNKIINYSVMSNQVYPILKELAPTIT